MVYVWRASERKWARVVMWLGGETRADASRVGPTPSRQARDLASPSITLQDQRSLGRQANKHSASQMRDSACWSEYGLREQVSISLQLDAPVKAHVSSSPSSPFFAIVSLRSRTHTKGEEVCIRSLDYYITQPELCLVLWAFAAALGASTPGAARSTSTHPT